MNGDHQSEWATQIKKGGGPKEQRKKLLHTSLLFFLNKRRYPRYCCYPSLTSKSGLFNVTLQYGLKKNDVSS